MAETADADQKTEAPSDKRRREAAERGEVLQSRELGTALTIAATAGWLLIAAPALFAACSAGLRHGLDFAADADAATQLWRIARPLLAPLLAFAGFAWAGALAGPLLTSARFSGRAAMPQLARINPIAGLSRMFGLHALTELFKAAAKAGLLLGLGWMLLRGWMPGLLQAGGGSAQTGAGLFGSSIVRLFLGLTLALALIAAIDLPLQMRRHTAKLRMTRQEVRDEARESEGAPELRAAMRRAQRMAARGALRPALAQASVVLVNPRHFAVALRYDPERDMAPIVVAKGRDLMAETIRDLAAERKVPVLRYPQLTRALFFTADVGQAIRDDLYNAVAVVLAFVFSLDRAVAAQPDVDVPPALHFDALGRREA